MFCPNCGFMNEGNLKVCSECGKSLEPKGPSFSSPDSKSERPVFEKGPGTGSLKMKDIGLTGSKISGKEKLKKK